LTVDSAEKLSDHANGEDFRGRVSANAELLWLLAEQLVLIGLPAVFGVFLAMRLGVRALPVLLAVALAVSGGSAMLVFWAYYLEPLVGQTTSFLLVLGSVLGVVWCWRFGIDRGLLRRLAPALGLWVLASAFVLFLGFLHGIGPDPLQLATTRFSKRLPSDNEIPWYFAEYFYAHGHHGTPPPFGDWLSSDRPPLQIGYVLAVRPFGWDHNRLHYEVMGIVVQQLWVVGMWALLCAARLRPFARGLAMLVAMVSDIAILHGFFVWPKLIAAAFVLAALALVLSEDWRRLRHSPWVGALFAALCALALLAHGSSAFCVVPLLGFAALRGVPDWRWLGIAALVGLALLSPWTAYQRYADPPGDRLIKWQLGGSLVIDDRGSLETILDEYRGAGISGTLANKWDNIAQVLGVGGSGEVVPAVRGAADEVTSGHYGRAIARLRLPRFFAVLPFLGILLVGPLAMLWARVRGRPDGPEWRFALTGFGFCAVSLLFWVLLMFGNKGSMATIHVGSLVVPLLAAVACVLGAYACYPRFAVGLATLNALCVLALYLPSLAPPPGTSYSPIAGLLAAASLAGFGWVALRSGRQSQALAVSAGG
jgi:hypothetical protein